MTERTGMRLPVSRLTIEPELSQISRNVRKTTKGNAGNEERH